jgi:PEP-CTERM motif
MPKYRINGGWSIGGGDYFPSADLSSVIISIPNSLDPVSAINQLLRAGYAVDFAISTPNVSIGHVVTVWGEVYDSSGYTDLYVTNSADGITGLVEVPISFDTNDSEWIYGSNQSMGIVLGLACNPSNVPEPATMLLLGLGLMGIAGVRRKFKK